MNYSEVQGILLQCGIKYDLKNIYSIGPLVVYLVFARKYLTSMEVNYNINNEAHYDRELIMTKKDLQLQAPTAYPSETLLKDSGPTLALHANIRLVWD